MASLVLLDYDDAGIKQPSRSAVPPTGGRVVAIRADLSAERWRHDRPRVASHRFLTTGNPEAFEGIGARLMGGLVTGVEQFA